MKYFSHNKISRSNPINQCVLQGFIKNYFSMLYEYSAMTYLCFNDAFRMHHWCLKYSMGMLQVCFKDASKIFFNNTFRMLHGCSKYVLIVVGEYFNGLVRMSHRSFKYESKLLSECSKDTLRMLQLCSMYDLMILK